MDLRKLTKEKEDIFNIHEIYISKLLKILEEKEIELECCNEKLKLANKEISKLKIISEEINKLKLENEDIRKLKAEINRLKLENEEVNKFKEEINFSKKQLKDKDQEIKNKNEEIEILRNEIIKAEDEIYSLKSINLNSKSIIIEDLKESFVENEYDTEELLDEILDNIEEIENNILFDDMMFLIYLCYFYERLEDLLSISAVANEHYSAVSKEAKLLKIVIQEENSKLYTSFEECTQNYINKNNDIFKGLENRVKERIIENLFDMSYRAFDGVYKDVHIEKDDKTINIKAWVKENIDSSWKLVSGLYSNKNDKLYLQESMISVLRLKCNNIVEENIIEYIDGEKAKSNKLKNDSISNDIVKIKEMFLKEREERFESLMSEGRYYNERNIFKDIVKKNISSKTISLNEAYTLLSISVFYGTHNILINRSGYLRSLYIAKCKESELVKLIYDEVEVKEGSIVSLPVSNFIKENSDDIKYIDDDIKEKILKIIDKLFYKEFDKVIVSTNIMDKCYYDEEDIYNKKGYVNLRDDNGDDKYLLLLSTKGCNKCNTLYIKKPRLKKINEKLHGYKLNEDKLVLLGDNKRKVIKEDVNKEEINKQEANKQELNKEEIHKEEGYIVEYDAIINAFNLNNNEEALLIYNRLINNDEALKYFSRMQNITLMYLGYIMKNRINEDNLIGEKKIASNCELGTSIDTILYERLNSGVYLNDYLEKYKDSLRAIDFRVKDKIISEIIIIGNSKKKYSNVLVDKDEKSNAIGSNEEIDGNNLNAESEIKKMGYSTSLGRELRCNILKNRAIPKLGKAKVMGHISFLIKMNRNRSVMANAVAEWKYDLDRLIKL